MFVRTDSGAHSVQGNPVPTGSGIIHENGSLMPAQFVLKFAIFVPHTFYVNTA